MFQAAYFSGLFSAPKGHKHRVLGGFYDKDFNYINSASLIRNYIDFQGPLDSCNYEGSLESVSEPCYYGGMILKHFGHFLLETLSRISNIPNDNSLVYFSVRPGIGVTKLTDLPYNSIRLLEHALGNLDRLRIVSGPCKFERINLSFPGYVIQKHISYDHHLAMKTLGESFKGSESYKQMSLNYKDKKVWLSRSSLLSNIIQGEQQFEDFLIGNDFLIVKPESISLEEQIAIFENCSLVAGFTGTAFHPALLCSSQDVHLIHFNRSPVLNNNFKTCLKYSDAKVDYYPSYLSKKKKFGDVVILADLYGMSQLLLKYNYVKESYAKHLTKRFDKQSFEREYMLSELFSTFSSTENLKQAIDIALKLSKKEI